MFCQITNGPWNIISFLYIMKCAHSTKNIENSPSSYSVVVGFVCSSVRSSRCPPIASTNSIDSGLMNVSISSDIMYGSVQFFSVACSQAYVVKKNSGIVSVSGLIWLNVFAKYAGTRFASIAASAAVFVLFVSFLAIKNAGIVSSAASMFGSIFSACGVIFANIASIASYIGLSSSVLPPYPRLSLNGFWNCCSWSIILRCRYDSSVE